MGFYYGREPLKTPAGGFSPVVTPREYSTLLACALRTVTERASRESDLLQSGGAWSMPGVPREDIRALSRLVRERPDDPGAHRILGLALLDAGQCAAGVRQLGTALNMLLREAAGSLSLHRMLCVRVEIAHLLLTLAPICTGSGKRELVRRLMAEVLLR